MPVSFTLLFPPLLYFCHFLLFPDLLLMLPLWAHLPLGKVTWEGRTAIPIFLHLKTWDWMSERLGHLSGCTGAWEQPTSVYCSDFWGLRLWNWKCSGYTGLFSFTRCSTDITISTTASLEQEKYSGWIPSSSMTTISFQAKAVGGEKHRNELYISRSNSSFNWMWITRQYLAT